jgi:hypothetical protein
VTTTLTRPQHMEALAEANRRRLYRADLKRRIGCGARDIKDVILSDDPLIETMKVSELLCAQYRWGTSRTERLLRSVAIGYGRTFGQLTWRQRHMIVAALEAIQKAKEEAAA